MGRWNQLRRDTASLEERPLRVFGLLKSGISRAELARRLGVRPVALCTHVSGCLGYARVLPRHRPRIEWCCPSRELLTIPQMGYYPG